MPTEVRIYYGGAAAGLRKLAEHMMQLHEAKPPAVEEKAKAGTPARG